MIKLGQYQKMEVSRIMPQGAYLIDEDISQEVLMPSKYHGEGLDIGNIVEVIVYKDAQDRFVATTEVALIKPNGFAYLEIADVNQVGAFADWGVNKHLMIPYSEQQYRLRARDKAVVFMRIDEVTHRLIGTTKIDKNISKEEPTFKSGQQVELLIYQKSDIGYKAIIDQEFGGLLYENELKNDLRIGEQLTGYIKQIREDGKIDLSAYPIGMHAVEEATDKILRLLKQDGGFLPYHDKTAPEIIFSAFGMSKKVFKKAIGQLYKQEKIKLGKDGIRLRRNNNE